jgi:hypothetical protein
MELVKIIGTWNLQRKISNQLPIIGTAVIHSINEFTVSYQEEVLTPLLKGKVIKGTQEYRLEKNSDFLEIFFCNGLNAGQIFQRFLFNASQSKSIHICAKDQYRSTWIWLNEESFQLKHEVKGPRKDYVMITNYFKII